MADDLDSLFDSPDAREGKFHFWLREHRVLMEWYDLSTHGPWHYVHSKCANLAHSLRNLIDWFPIVWHDRDYDHYFVTSLLSFKFRRMAKYFHESQIVVGSDSMARECAVLAALFERIQEDDYRGDQKATREVFLAAEQARRRDLEVATRILRKRLLRYWD